MNKEIWKDIKDYENEYQISNYGKIRSLRCWTGHIYITRNKILNPSKNTKGYLQVQLCKNGRRKQCLVHRIVAETFILKPNEEQNVVNHIDGNKLNNNVNNLEWCTQKQNIQHAIKNELFNPKKQGDLRYKTIKKERCR